MYYDYASALLATVSAFFWALSARQNWTQAEAGKLNAVAAGLSAMAAAGQALKVFVEWKATSGFQFF